MTQTPWRRLARDRKAATTIELAFVCTAMMSVSFAILEGGFLLWTRGAMQSTAELVARCVAVGTSVASSPCNTTDNAKQYAIDTMQKFVPISSVFSTSNVGITTVTKCPPTTGANGNFKQVTITSSFWSGLSLPAPWNSIDLSVTACYPV